MTKYKLEIKRYFSEDYQKEVNGLYVDDQLFDWAIDVEALIRVCANQALVKSVKGDIVRHFVASFSEALGRDISLKEINKAIAEGYIEA